MRDYHEKHEKHKSLFNFVCFAFFVVLSPPLLSSLIPCSFPGAAPLDGGARNSTMERSSPSPAEEPMMAKFAVILPAAGRSSRFHDRSYKKPFAPLANKAIWLHSAERFEPQRRDADDPGRFRQRIAAILR